METSLICLAVALIGGLMLSRLTKKLNLPAVTAYLLAGLLVKKIWTDVTKLYFVHNDFYYSYNEADLLTEIKEVDKRGNVDELVTYTYDEQNRLISMSDVEDDYYYATTYIYGQIELPESLAEDAKVWSETGLINYDVIDAG